MKHLVSLLPFLAAVCIAHSEASPRQQAHVLDATITHPVHLSYLLFLPATYAAKPDTHWPLILYLHGGSLRGGDVEQLRTLGLPHKLESEPDFPSWLFRRSVLLVKSGRTQRPSARCWIA